MSKFFAKATELSESEESESSEDEKQVQQPTAAAKKTTAVAPGKK